MKFTITTETEIDVALEDSLELLNAVKNRELEELADVVSVSGFDYEISRTE